MRSFPRPEIRDMLLLSMAAGGADAAGYLGLGRVFVSNMTGNLVLMGIELGQRHLAEALHSAYVLAIFVVGTCLGTSIIRAIAERDRRRILGWATGCEALLLTLFAALWCWLPEVGSSYRWVTFLALAMGLQSAALYRLKLPGVTTTAITGTLTSFVIGAMESSSPGKESVSRSRLVFQALVIGFYLLGAILNGIIMIHGPRFIGVVPAVCVLAVFVNNWRNRVNDRL